MKPISVFLVCICLFSGCKASNQELEQGLSLRQKILSASECLFQAEVTADYGDKLFTYAIQCQVGKDGHLAFTIVEPETICNISGRISDIGGQITFDDVALNFPLLAEGQLSPVSAPWVFIKSLRSGYLTSAGKETDGVRLTLDDSYDEDALQVDIWLNESILPVKADILHNGSRILSLIIKDFQIL